MKFAKTILAFSLAAAMAAALPARAGDDDGFAPGGTAIDHHTQQFSNLKIVMDLKAENPASVGFGATVASRILQHPGAKLVVIIEGPGIAVFAKKNYLDHQGIVDNWVDLAKKGVRIEYCGNSVRGAGLKPADMAGLSTKNPAIVNAGAYPTLAHYESQGYNPVVTTLLEK
ncbi:DsrE family protein [Sulfuriferula sp. AH1]|uniref:DsrE family protein n=1 Tax=Sulfuriferula sp. AH1 TaxID=1985873 RepID=UPI0012FCFD55|nr:DsrE family protein [Sulfuriferula sp. AH1]